MKPQIAGLAVAGVLAVGLLAVLLGGDDRSPGLPDPRVGVSSPSPDPGGSASGSDPTPRTPLAPTPRETLEVPPDASPQPLGSPSPGLRDPRGGGATSPVTRGDASLQFLCQDASGAPLSQVTVEVKRGGALMAIVPCQDGQGLLEGLPAGESFQGVARHPRSRDTVSFGPVKAGNRTRVELRFAASPTGTLVGRIVDDSGQPIGDATLVLSDPSQEGGAQLDALAMNLRPDGSFRCEVASGRYAVYAQGHGLSPSDLTYVNVVEGQEADAGQLVALPQASISGKLVLPGDLTAVFPVELDLVIEVTRGTTENPYTRTERRPLRVDASMRFEAREIMPGRVRLRVEHPEPGGNRVGPWAELDVKSGSKAAGVTLSLQEVMVSLRGVVNDEGGMPLEGATVSVGGKSVSTDRDGRYALRGLDPGDLFVEARKQGYSVGFEQVSYQGAELRLNFTLSRLGAVRGLVRQGGQPAAGVPVQVVERTDDGGVRPHETRTDGQGGFLVEGLPPGNYYLKAGPGADPFDDTGAPTVEVRAGVVVDASPIDLR